MGRALPRQWEGGEALLLLLLLLLLFSVSCPGLSPAGSSCDRTLCQVAASCPGTCCCCIVVCVSRRVCLPATNSWHANNLQDMWQDGK
jgi:hypothetical protein